MQRTLKPTEQGPPGGLNPGTYQCETTDPVHHTPKRLNIKYKLNSSEKAPSSLNL